MADIVLESLRALLLGVIVAYMWHAGRRHGLRHETGWRLIWTGFLLVFIGSVVDITDNFPALNRFVILGDTPGEAFLEKIVGYLCGVALLAYGFWCWIPRVVNLRTTQETLRCSHEELEQAAREQTAELRLANAQLKREMREREQLGQRLQQEKARLHVTLESIGDGVITTDTSGIIDYINPVAERLTGCEGGRALGQHYLSVLRLTDETTGESLNDLVTLCLGQDGTLVHADDGVLSHPDGSEYTINVSAAPMRDHQNEIIGAVLVLHDITEVMGIARQLSYQASHDMLTGLFNRREFERLLERAIRDARASDAQHVLLYMDLDQFKLVNDTCGHRAGDELLTQLAVLLRGRLREADALARLGGDEFGVLLESCPLAQATTIADELRQITKEFRFVWQDKTFEIGVSIGVVPINSDSGRLLEVMTAADAACYVAKDHGRNRIHVYQPDDAAVAHHHGEMAWVHRIAQAFEDERFVLYAQPIVAVAGADRTPLHYEVLIRMRDNENGLIAPMAFIPAAERYNLMPTLDRWVVRTTLGLLREAQGPRERPPIACTINLSGQTLGDDHFLDFVVEHMHQADVAPEYICFEITETSAISNLARAMQFIGVLRGMGCRFALDDFGSGVSSFAYLKNLHVDYLKIDGSFVKDMNRDAMDFAMVESINQIGHVMGLQTIAEFVEDESIMAALQRLSVDFAQGYGIGRPQPLDKLLSELASRRE